MLGEPPTLQLAERASGKAEVYARDIGRALHPVPGRKAISFIHKESDERWQVKRLDLETGEITPLITTPPGREDVAWSADGALWTSDGSRILRWRPNRDEGWQPVTDLAPQGIQGITRLALSPAGDRLALVAERP